MFRPRVIPVLLLKNHGLVKSVNFRSFRYIGDPINAVKIFNDLKADELVFMDITATREKRSIPVELVKKIGDEANMPFAVGGGIRTLESIKNIVRAGAEKVIINTMAFEDADFIRRAANEFGSSTIVVSIDVKKRRWGSRQLYSKSGTKSTGMDPVMFATRMQDMGAGEILLNSIENDGTMEGYDLELLQQVCDALTIPVVACGGAGNTNHLSEAVSQGHASAVAAGSLFIYHGPRKAVLVNYPTQQELMTIFEPHKA